MVKNNWFSQFLSDIININVLRPKVLETTALGVALFAGYGCGEFKSLDEIKNGIISIGAERPISNYFPVEIDLSNFHLVSRSNKDKQTHSLTLETT